MLKKETQAALRTLSNQRVEPAAPAIFICCGDDRGSFFFLYDPSYIITYRICISASLTAMVRHAPISFYYVIILTANRILCQSTRRGGGAAKERKRRQSKLAKENDISADEENEIKEAFHLFASKNAEFKDEKEGVMQTEDVRRALVYVFLQTSVAK